MEHLLIFPYNGNGIEAVDCIRGQYELLGFIDDTADKQNDGNGDVAVYDRSALKRFPNAKVLAVPGSPTSYNSRGAVIDQLGVDKSRFASVKHPSAQVSDHVALGYNTLIMAGVVLTSNCLIGDHVIILPNTVIHHDSRVSAYSLIGSNVVIAGNTSIGLNCYVGSGSNVINNITIGDHALIGMGSNVVKNVPGKTTVVGNPAKQHD